MDEQEAPTVLSTIPLFEGGRGVYGSNCRSAPHIVEEGNGKAAAAVSLTLIAIVWAHRMATRDPKADEALKQFGDLFSKNVEQVLRDVYWGAQEKRKRLRAAKPTLTPSPLQRWLVLFSVFTEVYLATRRADGTPHNHTIVVNMLEKVFWFRNEEFFGTMLAAGLRGPEALTVVVSGAGLQSQYLGTIDMLQRHRASTYDYHVEGYGAVTTHFDLEELLEAPIHRSTYIEEAGKRKLRGSVLGMLPVIPIVSTKGAVRTLSIARKKLTPQLQFAGYVVENHEAPGHNAPPRRKNYRDRKPLYTDEDKMDLDWFAGFCKKESVPFWLAGGFGSPKGLVDAQRLGAAGVQVGTLFALADKAGLLESIKVNALTLILQRVLHAEQRMESPTFYPFGIASVPETITDEDLADLWVPSCDIGYLSFPTKFGNAIVQRCAAEKPRDYVEKGGSIDDTIGMKCLCRMLLAAADYPTVVDMSKRDIPILTLSALSQEQVHKLLVWLNQKDAAPYPSTKVVEYMLSLLKH